jgi:hypothetical protein
MSPEGTSDAQYTLSRILREASDVSAMRVCSNCWRRFIFTYEWMNRDFRRAYMNIMHWETSHAFSCSRRVRDLLNLNVEQIRK